MNDYIHHDLDLLADHDEIELAELGDAAGGAQDGNSWDVLKKLTTILTGGACPTSSCTCSCNT